MHDTLSAESVIFAAELNNWRLSHNMGVTDLATLLNVSKQMVSNVLGGKRQFSAETAFRVVDTLNKFQGTLPMNNQTELQALDLVNAAVIKRHAGKAKIKHYQTAFSENDGWVPGLNAEPSQSEEITESASRIAELIKEGRLAEAQTLLNQIQSGTKVTHSTAEKAKPNPSGVTQVSVKNYSSPEFKKILQAAKASYKTEGKEQVKMSHQAHDIGLFETKNQLKLDGDAIDCSNVTLSRIATIHNDSCIADEATYHANLAYIGAAEARELRAKRGEATFDDAVVRLNQLRNS